jgi:hypothetical protein
MQREHLSSLRREPREKDLDDARSLTSRDLALRIGAASSEGAVLGEPPRRLAMSVSMVVPRRVLSDPVEPPARRATRRIVGGPPLMRDDKDLLHDILYGRARHSKVTRESPDKRVLAPVQDINSEFTRALVGEQTLPMTATRTRRVIKRSWKREPKLTRSRTHRIEIP